MGVQIKNSTALKNPASVRLCTDNEIQSEKDCLNNRSVSLKAYQTPKHCTVLYNTVRTDFTTLESYHSDNHSIFCLDDHEVIELPHSHHKVIYKECALACICALLDDVILCFIRVVYNML